MGEVILSGGMTLYPSAPGVFLNGGLNNFFKVQPATVGSGCLADQPQHSEHQTATITTSAEHFHFPAGRCCTAGTGATL
jgi:hypothetical protein